MGDKARQLGLVSQASPKSARYRGRRFGPIMGLSLLAMVACLSLSVPSAMSETGSVPMAVLLATLGIQVTAGVLFGIYKRAREAALVAVVGLVGVTAWAVANTGGLASPLLILFALPPVEAMMTGRKRFIHLVSFLAMTGAVAAAIFAMPMNTDLQLTSNQTVLLAMLSILYALSLAARVARSTNLQEVKARATTRAIQQFHHVTHDVFLVVERDGHVAQVFGAVRPILDCDPSDLRANGMMERVHIADRPSLLKALDTVHTAKQRDTVEVRLRSGEGPAGSGFLWVEVDLSTVDQPNGEQEIYAMVRDISAVKQHADTLTIAREKAEASDAAKGRFLATMSHELRTPLNAIIGFADILDEEVFGALGNEQQREYVGLIRESGSHLLQLVNDLLDMSKLDSGHFHIVAEPFHIEPKIAKCTRLVSGQIDEAKLRLVIDCPEDLPEVIGDQRAFRQVVINLLSNACKFTPEGGTITVRARQDGNCLVLSVSDTGIGIAAADLSKIGEPFFQANNSYDRNHHGTGLGLSVVKGLCELHDGSMKVTSVEGEGTTVTIRMPFAGPKAANKRATEELSAANTVVLAKLDNQRSKKADTPSKQTVPEAAVSKPQASDENVLTAEELAEADIFETEGKRAHG